MGVVVFPLSTEKITALNGRLFSIEKDDKYGLLESDGTPVTKIVYDEFFNPKIYDKGFGRSFLQEQKAALIYRKGDEVGMLTGLGKEKAFSLPRLIDNDRFYEIWGDKTTFQLKHSFYWKPLYGQALKYDGQEYVDASMSYEIIPIENANFEETVRTTISKNSLSYNYRQSEIDGHEALTTFTHLPAPSGRNNFVQKDLFIKINNDQMVRLIFSTGNIQLIRVAHEFFLMEKTIKILKK